MSFIRTEQRLEFTSLSSSLLFFPPPINGEAVIYGVRPFVGVESPITVTERFYVLPGHRLHGLDGAWLIRPSVGIGWNF